MGQEEGHVGAGRCGLPQQFPPRPQVWMVQMDGSRRNAVHARERAAGIRRRRVSGLGLPVDKGGSAEQIDTVIVRNGDEEVGHCRAMVLQPGASHICGNSWDEE